MVNVQNYYRHYGADPEDRAADSVSHYGRLYNLLTFNDGFHQEHHLSPGSHWSRMPEVRERHRERLDTRPRIVSPVPAMVGFLHRGRPLLHDRAQANGGTS
jgi:fatty acid desaturase